MLDEIGRNKPRKKRLKERIDDEELRIEPATEVCLSGVRKYNTGSDFDRFPEVRVRVVVISEITMLVEVRIFQGF